MSKILISWQAYNNDYVYQTSGSLRRKAGINEDGPNFNLHRYFWEDSKYEKHILLNSNLEEREKAFFQQLVKEINTKFSGHKTEGMEITIHDPIDVSEIFTKLQPLLAEHTSDEIEVFISPGTPAMQTAWYMLGTHYRKNVTLFQIRSKEFVQDKNKPEKILVTLDSSILPTNITIAQKTAEDKKLPKDILITESLEPIYHKASMIALTDDVGCLILGENGTGKENVARYIHENSNRRGKPFIAVNCAAFNDELLRSELFGHEKGSFTGADSKKTGVFEEAEGGTVFLDEIGDISQRMQVTLLRVLQEKKIQSIGSTKEIAINVRVISATNKDIERLCEQGEFRMDLFYRLAVTDIKVPPLRERGKKEILALMEHFNDKFSRIFPGKEKLKISKEAKECMLAYGYRGNVRELENMFIHFYTFCPGEIRLEDLPERVRERKSAALKLADVEKQHIIKVFNLNKQNILVTATALDIHRDTLKRKLKEYGIREES